jgi:hypothetical protein
MISQLEAFMRIINIPGNKMAFHDRISFFFGLVGSGGLAGGSPMRSVTMCGSTDSFESKKNKGTRNSPSSGTK